MFNKLIRALQLINFFVSVLGLTLIAFGIVSTSYAGAAIFSSLVFGILGANIGLHRLVAHRSFKTNFYFEAVLSFIGTLTTMGSTISWSGIHRYHHKHSDTKTDPHSPVEIGAFPAWVGLWKPVLISPRIVSDLIHSPLHRFLHKNYFKVIFTYVFVLAIFDPILVIFAYCFPASFCLQGSSFVTVFCHRWGRRAHETSDNSRNNWIASIMSLGEGWHNSHHANPSRYYHGEKWWEFDLSALIIKYILAKKGSLKI